jgi:hypothetical protein
VKESLTLWPEDLVSALVALQPARDLLAILDAGFLGVDLKRIGSTSSVKGLRDGREEHELIRFSINPTNARFDDFELCIRSNLSPQEAGTRRSGNSQQDDRLRP